MGNFYVFLGPPGAGKGTQAKIVAERLNLPHISSGDIFRENLKDQTPLGRQADGYMKRGELVPDELTIAMIRDRLSRPDCRAGAILDGFPRTPAQAEALITMLTAMGGRILAAPYIKVAEEVLIERLSGRWTCRAQGHIFHAVHSPPRVPDRCDFDGSDLYQREDDKPETVARRIRVYLEQTQPLIDFYQQKGLLVEIDGSQGIDQVTQELLGHLEMVK